MSPAGPPPPSATQPIGAARDPARSRKFRQAAFVYLHVGLLYEFVVFVLWREELLPESRGSGPVWLLLGAAITAFVVWGLWRWQHRRFAQAIWVLHALRLPALIRGAFFADAGQAWLNDEPMGPVWAGAGIRATMPLGPVSLGVAWGARFTLGPDDIELPERFRGTTWRLLLVGTP